MSKIIVNDREEVEGRFSVQIYRDTSMNPPVLHREGVFITEDASYFEVINTLKSKYYYIEGIDVYKETAGSEDRSRGYEFTYTKMTELDQEEGESG